MDGSLGWGHFPRSEYSPHVNNGAGGFLVTWHHNIGNLNYVFARVVSLDTPGFLLSGIQQVSDGQQGGTWWETGPAMAYSTTSHLFLVAWRTIQYGIQGRLVDANGTPTGGVLQLENPGGSRDPAVAWNAATDEFGLISTGWSSTSALAAFRRIRASDGSVSAPNELRILRRHVRQRDRCECRESVRGRVGAAPGHDERGFRSERHAADLELRDRPFRA